MVDCRVSGVRRHGCRGGRFESGDEWSKTFIPVGRCDFEMKSYDTGVSPKAALMSTTGFDGRVL